MSQESRPELVVLPLRRMGFEEAFRLQLELRDRCIESGGALNFLMLVEHPPTISIGRSGSRSDVLVSGEALAEMGVHVAETNRGGEVTFHGPGQLVAYPIIHLGRHGRDLHRYLRSLEAWLVRLCHGYGLEARGRDPQTGVWVGPRKIASIGIAVRRWVAYHGVALNVDVDLDHFRLIVPCGMPQAEITSLAQELGSAPPMGEVAARAAELFAEDFGMRAVSDASVEVAGR